MESRAFIEKKQFKKSMFNCNLIEVVTKAGLTVT
jgi:hypothetical protein